ncbi:MAG: zinc ABC transporter substrate-binding protein [Pseudomonadota bacterium]
MSSKCLIRLVLAVMLVMLYGVACAAEKPNDKIKVFVSIDPVAYFVKRVAGPLADVSVLVGPGQEPHTFEPTPKLITKLADAQVLFKIGFPFEEALIKKAGSTFKDLKVVDLQQGIKMRPIAGAHKGHGHERHGHGHSHDADGLDPHTWLNPLIAKIQAATIATTLIQIDPANMATYEENLKKFEADLDNINTELINSLAPVRGKNFFVFHPAFGYFADAYGLKQVPVEVEGKEPTARQLARLIEDAKAQRVKVIFAEPQFPQKAARTLAESIGGAVVLIDDLSPDYLNNLMEIAKTVGSALRSQAK